MKKKYFFFDIDGTLTDRATGKVVPSAQKALDKLRKAGHYVAIATGRAQYKARPFMESVGLHDMVCAGGGALVIDDQVVVNVPLDLEKAKAIVKEADSLGYGYLLMLDDSTDCWSTNDKFREQVGPRQEPTEYRIDPELSVDALPAIYKIYVSIPVEEEQRLTTRTLLGNMRFVPDYLMFQYDAKKQGILDMMAHLGAPREDVVVFGDDSNDLVMFDPVWTSIAMGNATDDLKAKADYVTAANVDDGIDKACVHFGWYEKAEA